MLELVLAVIGGITLVSAFIYIVLGAISIWLFGQAMSGGPKRYRRR